MIILCQDRTQVFTNVHSLSGTDDKKISGTAQNKTYCFCHKNGSRFSCSGGPLPDHRPPDHDSDFSSTGCLLVIILDVECSAWLGLGIEFWRIKFLIHMSPRNFQSLFLRWNLFMYYFDIFILSKFSSKDSFFNEI